MKIKKKRILKIVVKYTIPSLFAGLFISLSFPKYFIPFSYVIGFFILFKSFYRDTNREFFIKSILIGFFFSFFSFYWLKYAMEIYLNTNFIISNMVLILFSIVFAIYQFGLFSLTLILLKKFINKKTIFIAPFIWIVIEISREFFPFTGFPWNLIGYTLTPINEIAQLTSIGGIYFISLIALYISIAVFYFFEEKNSQSFIFIILTIIIFAGIYIYGYNHIKNYKDTGIKKKVALIQGNVQQNIKMDKSKSGYILDRYIKLLKEADRYNPDIFILSESSLPFSPSYIDEKYIKFFQSLKDIKTYLVLTGIDDIVIENIDSIKVYNTITLFNKKGSVLSFYRKIKLVPFGEYTPKFFYIFSKLFPYLSEGVDFSEGKEKRLIIYKDFKVVPLICFESIFPYFVGDFSKNGNVIVNVTNDAWFGNTSAPFQHFEMGRVRAIETGKYLVRVANTGISAVITPVGKIKTSLGINKTGILVEDIYLNDNKTFFVSHIRNIYLFYITSPLFLVLFFIFIEKRKKLVKPHS